jgi:hypothetical protein
VGHQRDAIERTAPAGLTLANQTEPCLLCLNALVVANCQSSLKHAQSRVIETNLKSLSSLMSYCPSLHLASSTSK